MKMKLTMGLVAALAVGPAFAGDTLAPIAPVQMLKVVPYAEDNDVADDIKEECQLGELLGSELATRSAGAVQLVDTAPNRASGRVLELEIVDAMSGGNAFTGHQKSTKIKGVLYQDGQRVAGFKARNNSMGGAFGGFKGSCAVLGRTINGLADSVVEWLRDPKDGVVMGD